MYKKEILSLLGKKKSNIVFIVLLMVLNLLLNISFTADISVFFYLVFNKDTTTLYYVIVFVTMLLSGFARMLNQALIGKYKNALTSEIKINLREKLYQKLTRLGLSVYDQQPISTIIQSSMEGIEQLDLYFNQFIPQFFYAMIAPLILFIFSVVLDYRVALVLLACVPLIPISIILFTKKAQKTVKKYLDQYYNMGNTFLDSIQGLNELKIYQKSQLQRSLIDKQAESFRKVTMKVLSMQLSSITIMDTIAFGGAGLGVFLAYFKLHEIRTNSQIEILKLLLFALFLILMAVEFFIPMRMLGSAFHISLNGVTASKKIKDILNSPEIEFGENEVSQTNYTLENVTYSYDNQTNIIKGISLKIDSQGFYAICGDSGSGKTTLFKLLLGIIKPQSGVIKLGESDLFSYNRASFLSHTSIVSYDSFIFNRSIRDNFKMANPNVSDEQIITILNELNLENLIIRDGLDTVISESSTNISGGERQRLVLAINVLADKKIMLLDESTSNIDAYSEEIIINYLKNISHQKTIIMITHRLLNTVKADNIFYLEDGKILESGDHKTLMSYKQKYYNAFTNQTNMEQIAWEVKDA